ncbi:MAG TPA: hypothetical protein VGV64_01790 [Thermoplasmata archaeon]|nr:hypothetical protein [Thermoplasmata archaeon]
MNDNSWYAWTAAGLAAVLVVGLLLGMSLGGGGAPARSTDGTSGTSASGATVDYVNLTIGWNPATGLDEYFPANFTVPAHTLVEITITSFDNGSNPVPAAFDAVQGTVGGGETITGHGTTHVVSSLALDGVAHTFTVMSRTSGGMMAGGGHDMGMLNVVVPPAFSVSDPVSVTFGAYFNATGMFSWNCMAPCDPSAMTTEGLMAGTVTVV